MSGTNAAEQDCECFAESRTKKACPTPRNVTHPLRYYEFTQEEMRALEECDRESFFQRCVPFSALLATITYAAIKNESLRTNPHFGAAPKIITAILAGYVLGRLSYLNSCDQKLRALPANSHLGNVMRKYYADNIAYYNPKPKEPEKK
ncbi:hypothetical protein B5X24_HaOG207299 [Helicoverpa armigera]|uniref:OCIA domain-containing protein n=1 Tax=Helicoverpa armigera TaxID=29058 RepID=A0A2W1BI47_HELAM|nr:hypothetical protein B5X24_HaOG207299 [Helicoverpa armigera]